MKDRKIALFCAIMLILAGTTVFAQPFPGFKELQDTMSDFTDNMAKSLPFNSTIGLNSSDAYIGQFLGMPPHFGAGISLGFVTTEGDSMGDLLDYFGISLPIDMGGYPLFGYTTEGRIGGFILPFDVGFKFGVLPVSVKSQDLKLDYLLTGFDVRYAVLEGKGLAPKISIGVGYNYLKGGLEKAVDTESTFIYPDPTNSGSNNTLTLKKPTVGIWWETSSLDFKAQISKSLAIITPFFGLGASVGFSKAGYGVEANIDDPSGQLDDALEFFRGIGITDMDVNGFSYEDSFNGWSFRAFGGLSLNLTVLKIDLTGLYNFGDSRYGFNLGARIQI